MHNFYCFCTHTKELYKHITFIKTIFNAFLPWNQALISHFSHTQRSWPNNKKLEANDVTSGTSQSFLSLFCSLDDCIVSPTSDCFLSTILLTTTEITANWTSSIWQFLTWRHNPFRNPDSLSALTDDQLHWAWQRRKL